MFSQEQLETAIAFGREQWGIEFKGPGERTEKAFMAKVVRAMLGMANRRDGGIVVVGVADDGTNLNQIGLSTTELATWGYDDLAASVANYADPYLSFDVAQVELVGKIYVVIEVRQFDSTPVICKKDMDLTLRDGALYVRPRGKVETVECPSHVEMREVVEIAAEIRSQKQVSAIGRLGLLEPDRTTERAKLDKEAEDLL